MYLLGIDGGGTKTHCVIGDENGNILSEGVGGASNHQTAGKDVATNSIQTSIEMALSKIDIQLEDIGYAALGLSGADDKADFIILNKICKEIFKQVPFKVYHDGWIALRAGSQEKWGIVSICGTGHGVGGITKDGRVLQLRNMHYELGNRGGGGEIASDALHYAFRGDECTSPYTKLQEEIPKIFGYKKMSQIDPIIRNYQYTAEHTTKIPVLVSKLAKEGDQVCQNILMKMGKNIGSFAAGVIRRLELEKEEVPVVVAGSVFAGDNPLFVSSYLVEVQKAAPKAKLIVLDKKPVVGAYYFAMDFATLQKD